MADEIDDPDGALIRRIQAGDKSAMRTLYEQYVGGLSSFVNCKLRDSFESADIVHDTFMEVWTKAARFEARASVKSWIYTIARNKSVDRIRKLSRMVLTETDEMIEDESVHAESVIAHAQDALRVRTCLEALSDAHRAAITLAFFEEMTYREISEVEGVSEGTIKTRVFHAKKLLMHCLSK